MLQRCFDNTQYRIAISVTAAFLMCAGTARAQSPDAVPAPPAAPAPPTLVLPEIVIPHIDLDALSIQLNAQLKDLDRNLNREMAERARDLARLERDVSRLGQAPVPPVPPVPPGPPDRNRERRRYPENWVEATEPYSRTFNVGRPASLLLVNISGNIQVTPGSGDQIEVQATKRVHAPNLEDGKRRLGDATIEAYATANRVELRVEYPARRSDGNMSVEFIVKVPTDAAVELRSVSGDIRVTNVKGEVRTQTVSGDLALEGTPRVAGGKSVSGDIQITNGGTDSMLSLSTVSGDLLVQGLNARELGLNTVSGDVRILAWTGERANLRTLSGDIDLTGTLSKGGRFDIESHSGDVRLAVPDQPGFELEANTFSGRIRVDFSIKSEGPIRDADRGGPRSIRGTYGDASSSLRIQTFSGDITVTRR